MSGSRLLVVALSSLAVASVGVAQTPSSVPPGALTRAMELETAGQWREAAAAFRAALPEAPVPAVLGLERVYSQIGWTDSIIPIIAPLIASRPREPVLRTVQLRALNAVGRHEQAGRAFESWVTDAGRDPAPYREYARLLLDDGRTAAADTVLRRAQRLLGGGRDFAMELGQLRAAMGLWEPAATSWREAVLSASYLHEAALFALAPTPAASREAVLKVLMAPRVVLSPRRVAASLALHWNAPREAWAALKSLPPDDSVAAAWSDFAERAEAAGSWLVARDALLSVLGFKPTTDAAARAATDALAGGDYASALDLALRATSGLDSLSAARRTLGVRARSLSALGRTDEAERLVRAYDRHLDAASRGRLFSIVARGWVRAGDLPRARAALSGVSDEERADVAGWIALYEGDLAGARRALRRTEERSEQAVLSLAFLARTRADSSRVAGEAFLALARGDTSTAAAKLVAAAATDADAAPLLLAESARLHLARGDTVAALATWQTLVERYSGAPESAEAELEWARALRASGQARAAIARLEHLILTHPQSALLPQARRELDDLRGGVPRPD